MISRIKPTLHGSQLRGATLSLEEKAALAQRYGYPGLDFALAEARAYPGGPAAVRDLLASHGLEASTVGGVFGARLTDASDAEFDQALQSVAENARQAASFGGERTGTGLPPRADRPKDELWPVAVERITILHLTSSPALNEGRGFPPVRHRASCFPAPRPGGMLAWFSPRGPARGSYGFRPAGNPPRSEWCSTGFHVPGAPR